MAAEAGETATVKVTGKSHVKPGKIRGTRDSRKRWRRGFRVDYDDDMHGHGVEVLEAVAEGITVDELAADDGTS
ncbi:hypothetical protein V6N13_070333 [Hibiscus sabdariffa]|uniref:Uncharacterized protein n=1 Tax=Hibiscus sabdariffa TaxID=183260 RepID=A0ABR2TGP4_9ROSI